MILAEYGWNDEWAEAFAAYAAQGLEPARVVCELRRKFYAVQTENGEVLGECIGKFYHAAGAGNEYPSVGDWVAVKTRAGEPRADIHALLPRRSKFSRRSAGTEMSEQVVAANIDTVFLVSGLDRNYNPRRIQRFLVAARESGAEPVILLNKSDLHDDPVSVQRELEILVPGVPVIITSADTRKGFKALAAYVRRGRTLAFVGSSGVGKSSLINSLMKDDAMPTADVREKDSKGRHTTTRRELVLTPTGAMVIDTPGMRELQLWAADEGVEEAFADIRDTALRCRFTSCRHADEPGCAVRAALAAGELEPARLENYLKLRAEKLSPKASHVKPSALASKPGWKQREAARQPLNKRRLQDER